MNTANLRNVADVVPCASYRNFVHRIDTKNHSTCVLMFFCLVLCVLLGQWYSILQHCCYALFSFCSQFYIFMQNELMHICQLIFIYCPHNRYVCICVTCDWWPLIKTYKKAKICTYILLYTQDTVK